LPEGDDLGGAQLQGNEGGPSSCVKGEVWVRAQKRTSSLADEGERRKKRKCRYTSGKKVGVGIFVGGSLLLKTQAKEK